MGVTNMLEAMRLGASKAKFEIEINPALPLPVGGDRASFVCNATKLNEATGWRPRQRHDMDGMRQALLDDARVEVKI